MLGAFLDATSYVLVPAAIYTASSLLDTTAHYLTCTQRLTPHDSTLPDPTLFYSTLHYTTLLCTTPHYSALLCLRDFSLNLHSVSILEGGFIGAVRHLREAKPSLSLSNALSDASVPVLEAVLNYNGTGVVQVPVPGASVLSLAARIRQSVTEVNANLRSTVPVSPAAASSAPPSMGSMMSLASSMIKAPIRAADSGHDDESIKAKAAMSSPPAPVAGSGPVSLSVSVPASPQRQVSVDTATDHDSMSIDASAPPSVSAPAPTTPAAGASSYFGGFGKKISAFGASSLDSVRSNIAAAQLAHQQQQEQAKQQQQQNPGSEKGAVMWSSDIGVPSSSSARPAIEGGLGFMSGLRSAIVSKINTARGAGTGVGAEDRVVVPLGHSGAGSTFVIDGDDEDEGEGDRDDGMGPREEVDPHKICVSKTDLERTQVIQRMRS